MDEAIHPNSDTIVAQWNPHGQQRFTCWGERDGARLPGTVHVRDLTELDHELAMSGLQTIPTFAIESVRRDHSRTGEVYAASVIHGL
jgi:hypothetical protein